MIWFANVGMVNERIFKKIYYKEVKDISNLIRKFMTFLLALISFHRERIRLGEYEKELSKYDNHVVGTTSIKATELVRKYIN